jgi:hypothetical protein
MKSKGVKGLTMVIITIIFIFVTILVALMVWIIFTKGIIKVSRGVDINEITLDLDIIRVLAINDSAIKIQIERNPGQGEFVGLVFVVVDGYKNESMEFNVTLIQLKTLSFVLNLNEIEYDEILEISLSPLIKKKDGEIISGEIESMFRFKEK